MWARNNKGPGIYPGAFISALTGSLRSGHQFVLVELVHGVVFTACLQSSFASEVLLVVVADVRASHVLVLDAGDTLTQFQIGRASCRERV